MEDHNAAKKFFAGLFFIAGMALIGGFIFVIGFNKGLTQPKFQVIVLFNEVGGLIEGSPIHLSGVNVGVVGNIDFLSQTIENKSLKVTLNIFKKYESQLHKCSKVSIRTEGVLGRKLVEIGEDHSRKVFDLTKPIIGEDPLDVEDMAAVITRTATSLQKTSEGADDVLTEWKYISHKARRVVNRVEDKLVGGNLFKLF
ncbi:MAG: MCE family protein [Candidatus Omnitrophica bacterium]|nr:MCE family protein [Candidatus Omnitrophota bacterium]